MTNDTLPPPAAPSSDPSTMLWSNSRIERVIRSMPVTYASMWRVALHEVRDEYEARIADLARLLAESRQHEDALASRVHQLEVQLEQARKWLPDSVFEKEDDDAVG